MRWCLVLACGSLVTACGDNASLFGARVDFATGIDPWGIGIGDVDGDGKPDLVVANMGANSVTVLLNTTESRSAIPSFLPTVDFTTGTSPHGVAVGDLNEDGKVDVVTANQASNTASVLLNATTMAPMPSFSANVDFAADMAPFAVAIDDLNNDGKPDIAIANTSPFSNSVSVLLNTTTMGSAMATFSAKVDFATGTYPGYVALGDLNGDGEPDIAIENQGTATVSVLLNATVPSATTPNFSARTDFATGTFDSLVGTHAASLTIGDLNGDGLPDLVVTSAQSDSVAVLFNTTTRGATMPSFYAPRCGRGSHGRPSICRPSSACRPTACSWICRTTPPSYAGARASRGRTTA